MKWDLGTCLTVLGSSTFKAIQYRKLNKQFIKCILEAVFKRNVNLGCVSIFLLDNDASLLLVIPSLVHIHNSYLSHALCQSVNILYYA